MIQIIKFGVVSVIAAAVDFGVLVVLKEFLKVGVLIASAISFCVAGMVNYILNMTVVFKSREQNKAKEFIIFTLLSAGGLCLNQFILWAGVTFTTIYYMAIKLFAMIVVPIYNFITRKIFLDSKKNECENDE